MPPTLGRFLGGLQRNQQGCWGSPICERGPMRCSAWSPFPVECRGKRYRYKWRGASYHDAAEDMWFFCFIRSEYLRG